LKRGVPKQTQLTKEGKQNRDKSPSQYILGGTKGEKKVKKQRETVKRNRPEQIPE
jgi:hypothetical protein